MKNDFLGLTGRVRVTLRGPDGKIKESEVCNLVVTTGKAHVADQLAGITQAPMAYMGIGTSTDVPDLTDTALKGTETSRKPFTTDGSKTQGTGADANKVVYIMTYNPGEGDGAITEAGIFNAASSGVMLARTTFAVKNKGAGDTLTFTWTLTIN